MASLSMQVDEQQGWHVVKLRGSLTEGIEDALLSLDKSVGANCIFDFDDLKSINSSGIAEWLSFRENFDKSRVVILQRCPSVVVDVLNLMPRFAGGAVVRSVYMPYVCTSCSKELSAHVEIKPGFEPESLKAIVNTCPKCQGALEPQVDPDEYFAFLA